MRLVVLVLMLLVVLLNVFIGMIQDHHGSHPLVVCRPPGHPFLRVQDYINSSTFISFTDRTTNKEPNYEQGGLTANGLFCMLYIKKALIPRQYNIPNITPKPLPMAYPSISNSYYTINSNPSNT
jgi:hypothetical protein